MGAGQSVSPDDNACTIDAETSAMIERQLRDDSDADRRCIKCLLLGAGECGKSTILKQMKILHLNGFQSAADRASYIPLIRRNTLDAITALCAAALEFNIGFDSAQHRNLAKQILQFNAQIQSQPQSQVSLSLLQHIKTLWSDCGIQQTYKRSNEFHLLDSAAYFLSNIDRTFMKNYDPTKDDILRSRLSTTGIIETQFKMDKLNFKMYDVGGQRGERKKWTHCFDAVTAIMYIASLSEYDQVLAEDRTRNRMKESMDLFEGINNLPWFEKVPIILFLNKDDIFRLKIHTVDPGIYFSHYNGGCSYEAALQFIQDEYSARNKFRDKNIYIHVTDATNTQNIEFVWRAAKHIILEMSLNNTVMF